MRELTELLRSRHTVTINGLKRPVHNVAWFRDEATGEVYKNTLVGEVGVVQHDIYTTDKVNLFWRGARING